MQKLFPVDVDLGHLMVCDPSPVSVRPGDAAGLLALTRDNAQLLVNALFGLPSESRAHATVVVLPRPKFALPRSKPMPKPRVATRWEEFAKLKGITKRKKDRMVMDESTGEYRPSYGYKSANMDRPWVYEHKDGAADDYDPFAEADSAKRKRATVEAKKQAHNLARAGVVAPATSRPASSKSVKAKAASRAGALPARVIDQIGGEKPRQATVRELIAIQAQSTASHGVFDQTLKNQPKDRRPTKKRKLNAVVDEGERARTTKALDRVLRKFDAPVLNVEQQLGRYQASKERVSAKAGSTASVGHPLVGFNPDHQKKKDASKSLKGITRGANFVAGKRGGRGRKRR